VFTRRIPSLRVKKDMVELASHILDRKAGQFDPGEFKDEYELVLMPFSVSCFREGHR